MSLKARIETQLDRLGVLAGPGDPQALQLDVDGGRLEAELTTVDQLACAFNHLTYHTDRLADASIDRLKHVANVLSSRLHYLLESISPIEIDKEACVVQLRSNPPQKDDDGTKYYELVVRRGEIRLCRYAKAANASREMIPANVTREVFARLTEDLTTLPD